MEEEEIGRLLDAVSDKMRRDIIFLLAENEHLNVGEITGHFRLSRPAISHHLKVLKDAGVVSSDKQGQEVYYKLDAAHVVSALRTLATEIEQCFEEGAPEQK